MERKSYAVLSEGWLDGRYRQKGETLSLSAAEAEHLVIAGSIALKAVAAPEETKTARSKAVAAPDSMG